MKNETLDWYSLSIPIPENIDIYPLEIKKSIFNYLSQLDNIQQKAYIIAKNHLGTSFHILRSTGYNEWLKNSNNK